jgi:cell wall assembly regulator SMI1
MRWAEHVVHVVESKCVYWVLVGKPEGKRPLGRPRVRWEDNTKMDLQEVGCEGTVWIDLAQKKGTGGGHL